MTLLIDAKPNLDFETVSSCNRTCPTCMRNSTPDKDGTKPWFEKHYLSEDVIYGAIEEAEPLGFFNWICLNFFNEPLMDERIIVILQNIKQKYTKYPVYFHSNGDLLNGGLARDLDGLVDKIIFTLYMEDPVMSKRDAWIRSLFTKTEIVTITHPKHVPTHFSPAYPVKEMAEKHKTHTCLEPNMRVVISHTGEYRLCCSDLLGEFNLGSFPKKSLEQHWNDRLAIARGLMVPNGRMKYPFCVACPRP